MPEVVPVSTDGGWKEWPVIDSVTTSDPEADQARATEAERQAQQLMTSYQDATNSRLSELPQFIRPPVTTTGVEFPGGQQVNPGPPGGGGPSVQPAGIAPVGGGGGAGSGSPPRQVSRHWRGPVWAPRRLANSPRYCAAAWYLAP